MSNSSSTLLFTFCFCSVFSAIIISSLAVDATTGQQTLMQLLPRNSQCQGTVEECTGELVEFGMESEISRRILANAGHISYGALQGDTIPCSRRGASYYNCKPGAKANPYKRGCNAIIRCRS